MKKQRYDNNKTNPKTTVNTKPMPHAFGMVFPTPPTHILSLLSVFVNYQAALLHWNWNRVFWGGLKSRSGGYVIFSRCSKHSTGHILSMFFAVNCRAQRLSPLSLGRTWAWTRWSVGRGGRWARERGEGEGRGKREERKRVRGGRNS